MENVEGKVVIITGASSGIGEETARVLAKAGAKVVLSARHEDKLQTLAAELGEGNAAWLKSDVTRLDDMQALVALAKSTFGHVDVAFANAGIMPAGNMSQLKVRGIGTRWWTSTSRACSTSWRPSCRSSTRRRAAASSSPRRAPS